MAASWFYWDHEEERGPVSSKELRRLARTGRVTPDTSVRRADASVLVPARRVRGLFDPIPPPIPPPSASVREPRISSPREIEERFPLAPATTGPSLLQKVMSRPGWAILLITLLLLLGVSVGIALLQPLSPEEQRQQEELRALKRFKAYVATVQDKMPGVLTKLTPLRLSGKVCTHHTMTATSVSYNVTKTESLVSPFMGILTIEWEDSARWRIREEDQLSVVGDTVFTFAFQDDRWCYRGHQTRVNDLCVNGIDMDLEPQASAYLSAEMNKLIWEDLIARAEFDLRDLWHELILYTEVGNVLLVDLIENP